MLLRGKDLQKVEEGSPWTQQTREEGANHRVLGVLVIGWGAMVPLKSLMRRVGACMSNPNTMSKKAELNSFLMVSRCSRAQIEKRRTL